MKIYYQTGIKTYIDEDYGYQYTNMHSTDDFQEALNFYHMGDRNFLWKMDFSKPNVKDMVEEWDDEVQEWRCAEVKNC